MHTIVTFAKIDEPIDAREARWCVVQVVNLSLGPRDRDRYVDYPMHDTPRRYLFPTSAGLLAVVAYCVASATWTRQTGRVTPPIWEYHYGWPVSFGSGLVHDGNMSGEGAWLFRQIRNTFDWEPFPIGIATNLVTAILLAYSAAHCVSWIQRKLNARVSIATLLGCTAFAAIETSAKWKSLFEIEGVTASYILEHLAIHYARRITWFCVFLACLTIPNLVTMHRRRFRRHKAT